MAYPHNAPSNAPPSHLPPSQPPTNPPPSMIASIPANPPAPQAHHPIHHHPPSLPPHPSPHAYPNYPPMPHNYPPSGPPPGYLMLPIPFPVKPLFNNILNAPDNIGEMRRRFFLLETPIIQSHYEHEIYWPFMDNFWVRNKVKDSADCRTEYYWCRLFRKQDQRSVVAFAFMICHERFSIAYWLALTVDLQSRQSFVNENATFAAPWGVK